jgi:CheY-like chemotaxis protein
VPRGDASSVVSTDAGASRPVAADVRGMRVLVVDDEISAREGMRTLLEQWGCDVVLAACEQEATNALRASGVCPDAIVMDFRLRGDRTGPQAIVRLTRELGSDVPALIVTGDTAPERLREARDGGYQLVHKPVQPAMLRAFLNNVRRRKRVT